MKFKDMPYERLDIQELGARQDAYTASLKEVKTYEEAVRFCRDRFYDLDGKPLNGGRA